MKLIKKQVDIGGVSVEYHCPAYFTVDESGAVIHVYHWQTLQDYQTNQTPVRTSSSLLPPETDLSDLVEALVGHEGGSLYGGEVITLPDDPEAVQRAKDRAWERIKAARDKAEQESTFEALGSVFQSDPLRVGGACTGAQVALLSGAPFAIEWTLADNTSRVLSASEMLQVGVAQMAYIDLLHQRSRQLRAALASATTLEEVDAILQQYESGT